MKKKIIGVTVGTPTSPKKIEDEIKPIKTVNRKKPDENGNVEVVVDNSMLITFTMSEEGEVFADKTIAECLAAYRDGVRVKALMIEGAVTYRGELVSVYTLEEDPQVVESVSFSLSAGAIKHIAITSSWDTNFGYLDHKRITLVSTDDKYNGEVIE